MTIKPKWAWFSAFTAVFAVLAVFVFWGAWALDKVPVMPDCPTSFAVDYVEDWIRGWNQSGKFVPSDIIAFLGSPYFWVELRYVLAIYCAALGMAYFLRGRGLSRLASYGAGLLLAFSGYWLTLFSAGHLGWFIWMTYGVFAFGLVDRALAKGKVRHWLSLGACLAWGSFHQPDLWLLFTVFTAAYFVFRYVTLARHAQDATGVARWLPRRWLKGAAVALASFVVIGLPSFRSAIFSDLAGRDRQIEEGQTVGGDVKDDAEKRWLFVTNWSMPPEDTVECFKARAHGDTSCPMTLAIGQYRGNGIKPYTGRLGRPKDAPSGNYRQHSLYVGWATCILALLGVLTALGVRRRQSTAVEGSRGTILFFLISGIVFYVFSLGRFCEPVYRLVYALPMGDYLRAPVKWHHLTEFCIVVLAGFGIDGLLKAACATKKKAPVILAALFILFGVFDLAVEAHRFCAPHNADTQIAPFTQYPIPADPALESKFADAVRKRGFNPVGKSEMTFQLADGSLKQMQVFWVEQKVPRPKVRDAGKTLGDGAYFMAVASVLATGLVCGFLLVCVFNKRLGAMRVG